MKFIKGASREQLVLIPENIDALIGKENEIRMNVSLQGSLHSVFENGMFLTNDSLLAENIQDFLISGDYLGYEFASRIDQNC